MVFDWRFAGGRGGIVSIMAGVCVAGKGGICEVPWRVLSTRLCPARPLLFRVVGRHAGWTSLVDIPLCHVSTHREQVLRDVYHPDDSRQQPLTGTVKFCGFVGLHYNRSYLLTYLPSNYCLSNIIMQPSSLEHGIKCCTLSVCPSRASDSLEIGKP